MISYMQFILQFQLCIEYTRRTDVLPLVHVKYGGE